ncbi:hypothetical protein CEXT_406851 [Caerostris extrusa]|uniref:Uncharacterized protein n=1 Tax=Caerostris extrusa TaxID=172846 RepID=A0AAV4XYM8_CAEEX|nr:hypothetical protein CEXT_406851 [Caerostris extrusa]
MALRRIPFKLERELSAVTERTKGWQASKNPHVTITAHISTVSPNDSYSMHIQEGNINCVQAYPIVVHKNFRETFECFALEWR